MEVTRVLLHCQAACMLEFHMYVLEQCGRCEVCEVRESNESPCFVNDSHYDVSHKRNRE